MLGPRSASSQEPSHAATEPELWARAPRDPGLESAWLVELAEQGVAVDPDASESPRGVAASVDPLTGDPQLVAVIPEGDREAFCADRRFMRLSHSPRTSLAREEDVVRAADLADRAQLALGEPVLVHYACARGRLMVTGVRRLVPRIEFTNASYRATAPMPADVGTFVPLAIDALGRALRIEGDRGEEPRVRRIFARAYRRIDEHHTPWATEPREALRALHRLTRLGRDVTLALTDARAFRRELVEAVASHDAVDLTRLDRPDLVDTLQARLKLVTDALALLERGRLATLSLLPPLEAVCGVLPRETFDALSAPARTSERRAIDARLTALARRCRERDVGLPLPPSPADGELANEWRRLARSVAHVRVLGLDLRPEAMGADDAQLVHAVHEAWANHRAAPEQARRNAERRIRELALAGPLGVLGVAPATALVVLLSRLARAKGSVAEGLSAALLRLRAAALEAGRRLAGEGILERAEDALFMEFDEIEEAIEGELGAYAARVRQRREDDRRWRNFSAPRWITGRKA